MTVESKVARVQIKELGSSKHAHRISEFMATSEPWKTLHRTYEEGMSMMDDPVREVYVALVDGELAGFTILRLDGAFVGYIQTIGVLPQWRNQGIGSKLMKAAEDRIFRETPNAFICASSFNPDARRLYERLGYAVVGEMPDYIAPGHSEILMRKTIAPLIEFKKR